MNLLSPELRARLGEPAGSGNSDVALMASVVCTPPLVPYRLLRRMRRSILPAGTLDVEAGVCSGWFVESIAADGFVFETEYVTRLRSRLRRAVTVDNLDADLDGLHRVIDEEMATLSPLLRIEEHLCWAYVTRADFTPVVDKILTGIVQTVAWEGRTPILTWAAGAFARLPREMFVGPAAWVLAQLCRAAGLPGPMVSWPEGGVDDELLHEAMALVPDTLLGIHRDGRTLEIGPISMRRRIAILVPAVSPKMLTISRRGEEAFTTRLAVDVATRPIHVHTGRDHVDIQDMSGRTYKLAAFTDEAAPEHVVVDEALAELDRRWRTRKPFRAVVTRALDFGRGVIVSFPEFPGCTALLPASRTHIEPFSFARLGRLVGHQISVRVINMDQPRQRVVVERILPKWTTGNLREGTTFRGPVTSKANFGIFVSFASAAGLDDELGSLEDDELSTLHLDGLVHRTELARGTNWTDAKSYPVEVGDFVDVYVMAIDLKAQRVNLSIKRAQPDPFTVVATSMRVGDRVRGPVTKVQPYGWFIKVIDHEALLHTSEAPVGTNLAVGSEATCWILAIDVERSRVSLTLRPPPWPA